MQPKGVKRMKFSIFEQSDEEAVHNKMLPDLWRSLMISKRVLRSF